MKAALKEKQQWFIKTPGKPLEVWPREAVKWLLSKPLRSDAVPPGLKAFITGSEASTANLVATEQRPALEKNTEHRGTAGRSATRRNKGRPTGTGYQKQDEVLVKQMRERVANGKCNSPTTAAWEVIGRDGRGAEGIGTPESKVRRLVELAGKQTENNRE
jgi:hypothetical protein